MSDFEKCLAHDNYPGGNEVEELSVEEFDPRGEYKGVINAVRQAGKGEVVVFRVAGEGARVEYYVLTLADGKEGGRKLVGVVTKAVES